jgi:hypothetical protein
MTFQQKYKVPVVGKRFGEWVVVGNTLQRINNGDKSYAKGIAVQCKHGTKRALTLTSLYKGKTKGCDKCGAERQSIHKFVGVGELSSAYFNRTKNNALKRKIEFNITIQEVWNLFVTQKGKCALTGVKLTMDKRFAASAHSHTTMQTASLDRIDSKCGYVKGNVQWVDKDVNMLKRGVSQERFIELCTLVARGKVEKKNER